MAYQFIGGNLIRNIENVERQRFDADDPFEMSDFNFIKLYRLRKEDVDGLEELLQPFLPQRNKSHAISNRIKILSALRFFASGSYQLDIGRNHTVTLSQPSVSRCLHEVLEAFNNPGVLNRYINFPNTIEQLTTNRERFFAKYHIPGIIGCIDCTHIAIVSPVENEHIYVNRKNFHSLNVQMICDERLKIINVNARFPGSTHDCFIWRHSTVEQFLRTLPEDHIGNFYLLGDSGYPLRPWLIPYLPEPPPNTAEARFNENIRQIRVLIEQCFGLLKNRFRCLLKDRVLHYAPETAAKIVNSCAVLHNICVENNIPLHEEHVDLDLQMNINNFDNALIVERGNNENNFLDRGRQIRNFLARNYV